MTAENHYQPVSVDSWYHHELRNKNIVLQSANTKLMQALDKYGEHTAKCREQRLYDSRCGVTVICICGLDSIVQALTQVKKPDNSQFKEAADILDKALND